MQTDLNRGFLATPRGREADRILRSCVHCGFCNATCPTYQLLGDELDGPRGRIYLIKQLLEDRPAGRATLGHLDRCLTCQACETTCPSGVEYGRLAEIGRAEAVKRIGRPWRDRLFRWLIRRVFAHEWRSRLLLGLGSLLRPVLPARLRGKVPVRPAGRRSRPQAAGGAGARRGPVATGRKVLALRGCVQPAVTPATNRAAARVLERLGIAMLEPAGQGCCGALSLHNDAGDEALNFARRNIDAWWPLIEGGAEAIVVTASGCGTMVKDYGRLLAEDPVYADRASKVAGMSRDVAELIAGEDLSELAGRADGRRIAFHSPCSLQHGQGLDGRVEAILRTAGYRLTDVPDKHLCCGSAGSYSLLQTPLATQLLAGKLEALESGDPELIASANAGCQLHLASGTAIPVAHWIELLDQLFEGGS